MNIFLDTNVIIGYIYSLDALHSSSRKAIVRKSNNYYSFHVNQEVICVSRRKDREYSKFLIELGKIYLYLYYYNIEGLIFLIYYNYILHIQLKELMNFV